jgi:hypothetical protein
VNPVIGQRLTNPGPRLWRDVGCASTSNPEHRIPFIGTFAPKPSILSVTAFLFTPPFTQLNTPYPATAYLKGFLNTKHISSFQADLGIEVTLALFGREGLTELFAAAAANPQPPSDNAARIQLLQNEYVGSIDQVVLFLQGKNPTMAHLIAQRGYLPEAGRFAQVDDLHWAFGTMGTQDKAKHLATLYLEDLSDFISERVDPHFGFSRYAERLGRSASSFDGLYEALQQPLTHIDRILLQLLQAHIERLQPQLVAISVPFPGNLYAALRCGQWIKQHHPAIKVAMGGGFANTELRSLSDPRVFEMLDFVTLDDGEAPIENLLAHLGGQKALPELKRTFTCLNGTVTYINNTACTDYRQGQVGTPDYSDLWLDRYISAIEVANPMHRLWSDGRWNKLTMAHGCYWGKCTFCDISLDYIARYEPLTAALLCDRMEEMMAQTGQNGFHFVDEAAPPALMRELSLEILRRGLVVSWWTNIRFEKAFTRDLCLLLKAAGCVGVSGGLEVASDRLLQLIQKGITVAQVARVNQHFTEAGIMVHAYLMYGFPTQTAQETIDSLEMVRQLFSLGILQSAFWHQFAMTAHSPVGLEPDKYKVVKETAEIGSFANNDIVHHDPTGADHDSFSFGLKKSLLNYMYGIGLDEPLQKWFDQKVPKTTVAPDYIRRALEEDSLPIFKPTARVVWLGHSPKVDTFTQSKKGRQRTMASLSFATKKDNLQIQVHEAQGLWLAELLPQLSVRQPRVTTLQQVKDSYEAAGLEDFELFWDNKPVSTLYKAGLIMC